MRKNLMQGLDPQARCSGPVRRGTRIEEYAEPGCIREWWKNIAIQDVQEAVAEERHFFTGASELSQDFGEMC